MELLPDDLLADVLGRLPPCDLAASRCVRKRWCGVADLLPLRLDGFFCLSVELDRLAHFFARPSTGRRVGGGLDFVDADEFDRPSILDHCNGLLLLPGLVVNPATRRCAPLPPFPDSRCGDDVEVYARRFLAFDPMASPPHYQVVSVPFVLRIEECMSGEEWPLLSYTAHVFSSRKGSSWEERTFVREGEAFGTCAGMLSDWTTNDRHAVYWRGVLYVHCQDYSVMRITLSNDKYQMIKSPAEKKQGVIAYLGKSEKGVYSALLWEDDGLPRFRVWFLSDSCGGHMDWILKSDISIQAVVQNFPYYSERSSGPWIVNYREDGVNQAWEEDESEWDFHSGVILHETKDKAAISVGSDLVFLGFHPYKEIAFFQLSHSTVVSYHLNTLNVQELGLLNVRPIISKSFPYTPCWMEELFENN